MRISAHPAGRAQQKNDEAAELLREALDRARRVFGEAHANTLMFAGNLGETLRVDGQFAQAETILAPLEAPMRAAYPAHFAFHAANLQVNLARTRMAQGYTRERFSSCERLLLEAHPSLVETRGERHGDTLVCIRTLARLYTEWNIAKPGAGYDAKAAQWNAKLPDAAVATPPAPR